MRGGLGFLNMGPVVKELRSGTYDVREDPPMLDLPHMATSQAEIIVLALTWRASPWEPGFTACIVGESWVWRRMKLEEPLLESPTIDARSPHFLIVATHAEFLCGCISIRRRCVNPEQFAAMVESLSAYVRWTPDGFVRDSYLSDTCCLHRAMIDVRDRNKQRRVLYDQYTDPPFDPEETSPAERGWY